ncbi:DUF2185 domain-containing protein [Marinicrinis lubricantis]|uniref:DUF2185 domain-containing protein n=1 Tax=Marinicrinis lubricantis TaxID=2086470 RepID=A0ABW1IP73_9BACL
MRRDSPYSDCGWRFLAGDESDEYMEGADNHGIFLLNSICNYDPDIIPLQDSPPGTAYYRNEQGIFELDRYEEE